jgi:hypothetical protein
MKPFGKLYDERRCACQCDARTRRAGSVISDLDGRCINTVIARSEATKQSSCARSAPNKKRGSRGDCRLYLFGAPAGAGLDCFASLAMTAGAPHNANVNPPFAGYVCPVIQLLASEARNSAMLATSSGCPGRPPSLSGLRSPAFALRAAARQVELRRGESSYGAARRMMVRSIVLVSRSLSSMHEFVAGVCISAMTMPPYCGLISSTSPSPPLKVVLLPSTSTT